MANEDQPPTAPVDPTKGLEAVDEGDELFFGIARGVGIDGDHVYESLRGALLHCKYNVTRVKYSELIESAFSWSNVPREFAAIVKQIQAEHKPMAPDRRTDLYQDLGNAIRRLFNEGDSLSDLAILKAGAIRVERTGDEEKTQPLERHAFVFDSLKHPDEVTKLRKVYGTRFYLIGAHTPLEDRITNLAASFAASHGGTRPDEFHDEARRLARRDELEKDEELGQQFSETYGMSDFFVKANAKDLDAQLRRLVEMILGYQYHTPTRDEHGMAQAYMASLRSAALARQIGASLSHQGSIVALGCNDVPRGGGGLYWSEDKDDARDFVKKVDESDKMRRILVWEIIEAQVRNGWLQGDANNVWPLVDESIRRNATLAAQCKTHCETIAAGGAPATAARSQLESIVRERRVHDDVKRRALEAIEDLAVGTTKSVDYVLNAIDELLHPILKEKHVMRLNEFGRTVHAEMAAMTDAAMNGIAVRGTTLYTTTFPCHECTRHIVASGIHVVQYVEPYPKSYAREQHGDALTIDAQKPVEGKTNLQGFVGVAPRRYFELFSMANRGKRKGADGRVVHWDRENAIPVTQEPPISYLHRETLENNKFRKQVATMQLLQRPVP